MIDKFFDRFPDGAIVGSQSNKIFLNITLTSTKQKKYNFVFLILNCNMMSL